MTCLFAMLAVAQMSAQVEKFGIADHLGAGVSVGLDGIGFEVATPITDYVSVRAGMSILPSFSFNFDVDTYGGETNNPNIKFNDEVNVEGKIKKTDFKLLFDVYPFPASSFRFTAGAYIGNSKLISATNTNPIIEVTPGYEPTEAELAEYGVELGDYKLGLDDLGNIDAAIKVNSFKPYLGIGFGRAVPRGRLGFAFDLGVQFWGKPSVWGNLYDENTGKISYRELKKDDFNDKDADKFFDIMSKIIVYPVMTFRLQGRIL